MSQITLITGASSGIGYELAKTCGANGHSLLLVARREAPLKALKAELEAKNQIQVWTYQADLTQAAARQQLFEWVQAQGLTVDGLINNAGFGDYGPFAETDWDKQDQMLQLNIVALTHLSRLFLPAMIERRRGRVLNVASIAAFQPGPLMAVYFATKAYVLSLSSAIASELESSGVTVTALCPGPTDSEFLAVSGMGRAKLMQGRKLPSAAAVAKFGYQAMQRGDLVAVPGFTNQVLTWSTRLLPRKLLTKTIRELQAPA